MGKNKHKGHTPNKKMKALLEKRRELDMLIREIEIPCSHTDERGNPTIEWDNRYEAECTQCGAKFSLKKSEFGTLKDAVAVCCNAINQIKISTSNPENDKEAHVLRQLGELSFNLKKVPDLYSRVFKDKSKNKKNKKKNKGRPNFNEQLGGYNYDSLDLIGGGGKKKKKDKHNF